MGKMIWTISKIYTSKLIWIVELLSKILGKVKKFKTLLTSTNLREAMTAMEESKLRGDKEIMVFLLGNKNKEADILLDTEEEFLFEIWVK